MRQFQVGCPCCNPCSVIGFEGGENPGILDCCRGQDSKFKHPAITQIYQDIEKLTDEVKVLFAGAIGCSYSTLFTSDQHEHINQWITNGGRLYVAGEYSGCIGSANLENLNSFISGIGSEMQVTDDVCECTCSQDWTGILNPDLPLLDDVEGVLHACTAGVSGGTWVATTAYYEESGANNTGPECSEMVYIAIEKIGEGYILVSGDSNIFAGCPYDNCPFWRNFIELDNLLQSEAE